jgi:hypothetical protein
MDATTQQGDAMKTGYPTVSAPPFMTLVKSIIGFAVAMLFFVGACAGLLQMPFGPAVQLLVAIVGATMGGVVAWYSHQPAEK